MARVTWSNRIPAKNRANVRGLTRRLLPENEVLSINTEELVNDALVRRMRSDIDQSTAANEAEYAEHELERLESRLRHVHRMIRSLKHNVQVLTTNGNNKNMLRSVREQLASAQQEEAELQSRILDTKRQAARDKHRANLVENDPRIRHIRERGNRTARRYQKRPENTRERGERITLGGKSRTWRGASRKRPRSESHHVRWSSQIPNEPPANPLRSRHPAPFSEERIAQIAAMTPGALRAAQHRNMPISTRHSIALNIATESEDQQFNLEAKQRLAHRLGNRYQAQKLLGNTLKASRHAARNLHRAEKNMKDLTAWNIIQNADAKAAAYGAIPVNTRERGDRITY